jgi:hypothetical protein
MKNLTVFDIGRKIFEGVRKSPLGGFRGAKAFNFTDFLTTDFQTTDDRYKMKNLTVLLT